MKTTSSIHRTARCFDIRLNKNKKIAIKGLFLEVSSVK